MGQKLENQLNKMKFYCIECSMSKKLAILK